MLGKLLVPPTKQLLAQSLRLLRLRTIGVFFHDAAFPSAHTTDATNASGYTRSPHAGCTATRSASHMSGERCADTGDVFTQAMNEVCVDWFRVVYP